MRELRGDGGRESASSNSNKAADPASEFQRMDWKGSSERELSNINNNSSVTNIRTERKDARGDHRGSGGGTDGREVTTAGRRGESRSGGGGDNSSGCIRERKSSDDLLRVSNSSAQETGPEVRETWGSRTFLKSSGSSQAPVAAATPAAPTAKHGGEEEGEIGDFTDDGGVAAAGGGEPPLRFEETKRKRDERGGESRGVVSHINSNNNMTNSNNVTEREDRQRDKSERRSGVGGDLQVHISFVPPSQHLHREKEREEKQGVEREKAEKESTTTTTTTNNNSSNSKQKEKDKAHKEKEDSAVGAKEKSGSGGNKESEVESRRGDKEVVGDVYNSNRRKEAAAATDQEDKDQNNPTVPDRVEKRVGGVPLSMVAEFDQHESAAGTSGAGGGKSALQQQQQQQQEENSNKVGGEADSKERPIVESKEQHHEKLEKGKSEPVVEEEKEKGKRKLRDYDRAAGGGDDANNNNNNADGGEDFEREVVSSYGIQRKRLLRPRGHYQGSNTREVRPRFRLKDPETPERTVAENSTLVYRAGEGLQEELRRVRKEFDDRNGKLTAEQHNSLAVTAGPPTIEVRIPAELATTSNRQVQGSQLWGTDVYTDDSDLVAILMHTGYYAPSSTSPANTILELRATVKVLAGQERYTSTLRNALRSRSWGAASGCSLGVESCYLVKKDGAKVQLEPRLTFTPAFAPTLAPAVTERTVTTRAVSMNAYRAQRFVQEVTIQYNLCNEPWLKYSMNIVADKGLKKSQYTSARLKKNDVLYVETHFHRYELSFEDPKTVGAPAETKALVEKGKDKAEMTEKGLDKTVEKGQQGISSKEIVVVGNNHNNGPVAGDKYRWALCKWPLSLHSMRAKGVPLSLEYLKVLESGLGWEEVQWSPAGVCVRGKEYPLARAHFVPLHE